VKPFCLSSETVLPFKCNVYRYNEVWNLMTYTAWRTIAVPCAGVVAHLTLPAFTVTVVPGAAALAAVAAAGVGEDAAAAAGAAAVGLCNG
jgi:hypothetical protein